MVESINNQHRQSSSGRTRARSLQTEPHTIVRATTGKLWEGLASTRLNPLIRSRATVRRNHHRLARDMTGRGLIISSTIKSSQIIGHIQGWIIGSPARAKESQKAQQRVARAKQGSYNKSLLVVRTLTRISEPAGNAPRSTLDDQDEIQYPTLHSGLRMIRDSDKVTGPYRR